MKFRKMFTSKRAFSAVIASLILMLLAVAAGVVVYAYVMGWIGGQTQNPQRTGQLQFDSLYADATTDTIKIYVRNVGGTDLNVTKIYVNGVEKTNSTPITNGLLSVQNSIYLEVNSTTLVQNYFYEVAVVCKDGTSISQSTQAK